MSYTKTVELILIKNSVVKGINADSRIKSKLRSYGNSLVNHVISYLNGCNEKTKEMVVAFPESRPDRIKYLHSYIIDTKEVDKIIETSNLLESFMDKLKTENPIGYLRINEKDIEKLSMIAVRLLHTLTVESKEYSEKVKQMLELDVNTVFRIYLLVDDNIPDLTTPGPIPDLFIKNVFNKILSEIVYDVMEKDDDNDVQVCCVVDDELTDEKLMVREPKNKKEDSRNYNDLVNGECIYNDDGSIRSYYFRTNCRYMQ